MRAARSLDAVGETPLIELPRIQPPGGSRILLKWEGGNPTGSMKDRMALAMVRAARRSGELRPGQRIVEFTGGSTGASLAFVAAVEGHPISIVTADCFSEEKIRAMQALGADVDVLQTPEGRTYPELPAKMRERVLEIQRKTGAYWTNQFENTAQLEGYAPMADEILRDAPEITDFVCVVGTGGCAMGNARRLRQARPHVRVHLVEPAESPGLSQGRPGKHSVEGIALGLKPPLVDDRLYDDVLVRPEADGRAFARRLAKEEGVLVGTSSGLNVAAAYELARKPGACIVTVGADTGLKYLRGDLFMTEQPKVRAARARREEKFDLSARIDLPS